VRAAHVVILNAVKNLTRGAEILRKLRMT